MDEVIKKYLEAISIGELQVFKNIGILPLLLEMEVPFEYSTLDEALNEKVVTITEVTEQGNIPNLKLVNRGPKMVLILEGEELVGAKQNRIANITMLIGGHREVVIPVSCVERGRWSYKGKTFGHEGRVFLASMRKNAHEDIRDSIAHDRGFYSNQFRVWNGLSEIANQHRIFSLTGAMSEIYLQKESTINECLNCFYVVPNQVGMVVFLDNKVVGLDSFGRAETLEKMYRKLVSSYALEVLNSKENEPRSSSTKDLAFEFLDKAKSGRVDWRPSVDLGMDGRVEGDKVIGSCLAFEDQLLHLAVFSKRGPENRESRIHRPFRR